MAENRQLAIVTGAASGIVTGRRFLATHWDNFLPPPEAAEKYGAPIACKAIATYRSSPNE